MRLRILHRKVQRRRYRLLQRGFEHMWASYAMELAALPAVDIATTFEVRCDEGDERIGQFITRACLDAGLVEVTSAATWVLRLISSKTDYTRAREEIAGLGARAICVLVDSVSLPEDSGELRRHQWLDFREQLPEGLYNLLRGLRSAERTGLHPNPVPLNTSRFRVPRPVQVFVELCHNFLAFIGAFAIGLPILRPLHLGVVTLAFASLLLEIYLWRLLRSTTARLVTGKRFRIRWGVLLPLVLMWIGCLGALNPVLLSLGVTVMFGWALGFRLRWHLTEYWLPSSVTVNKTPAAVPTVFTSYLPAPTAFYLGMAAMFSEFLR